MISKMHILNTPSCNIGSGFATQTDKINIDTIEIIILTDNQ